MTTAAFPMPPSRLSPNPLYSHPTQPSHQRTQSQTQIVIPSMKYTATRLQCVANYKLRIESTRNEPRLRNLLGHISIYDNVREYRKEQLSRTSCASEPYPKFDAQQQQQQPTETTPSPTPASNELQEYLQLQQVRVPSFQDFQAAIELQLATLSEIQSASKRLQARSVDRPTTDEEGEDCDSSSESDDTEAEVEEYRESDCDSDTGSEYDSYDGEGDWSDDEDDGADSEDSMTDPESARSECSSPVEESMEEDKDGYFGLRPLAPLVGGGISVHF